MEENDVLMHLGSPWIVCRWNGEHEEGLGHRSHRCYLCLRAEVVDGELLSSGGLPMAWVVLQDYCFSLSGCVGCETTLSVMQGCVSESGAVQTGASSTRHFPGLSSMALNTL